MLTKCDGDGLMTPHPCETTFHLVVSVCCLSHQCFAHHSHTHVSIVVVLMHASSFGKESEWDLKWNGLSTHHGKVVESVWC